MTHTRDAGASLKLLEAASDGYQSSRMLRRQSRHNQFLWLTIVIIIICFLNIRYYYKMRLIIEALSSKTARKLNKKKRKPIVQQYRQNYTDCLRA